MKRRTFLSRVGVAAVAAAAGTRGRMAEVEKGGGRWIQTVRGKIAAEELGQTLAHEHVLVDFIGAEQVSPTRYDAEEVFRVQLQGSIQLQ